MDSQIIRFWNLAGNSFFTCSSLQRCSSWFLAWSGLSPGTGVGWILFSSSLRLGGLPHQRIWQCQSPPQGNASPYVRWRLLKEKWRFGVLLQVPPSLPPSLPPSSLLWSAEEKDLHFNILGLKVVILALDTFKNRVIRKELVFMSDSAMVMTYLQRQGGTMSLDMCKLTQEVMDG